MNLILAILITGLIFMLCYGHPVQERKDAAVIYAKGTVIHFALFEGMALLGINYFWSLYYLVAGLISLLIISGLNSLKTYTKFHRSLQFIAFASIVINFLGGLFQYLELQTMYYELLGLILYLILIRELLKDGENARISRNSGFFNRFYLPTLQRVVCTRRK